MIKLSYGVQGDTVYPLKSLRTEVIAGVIKEKPV